jgi:hypothetical protein
MNPLFDFAALLDSLSVVVLVAPAVLALIVFRAVLLRRIDRRDEAFHERCQRIDVERYAHVAPPRWDDRRAA